MRLQTLAAATALTLALGGCATSAGLHPRGSLLDASSLQTGRALGAQAAARPTWPAHDWWTGLGDPQLDHLIREALADNPSLEAADARTRQSLAAVGAADAARGPDLNAGASIAGAHLPTTVLPADVGGGSFSWAKYGFLSFNWGLDLWGGKRAAWEAAVGQSNAAQVAAQAARVELSVNVAHAYAQLGYAFDQQDIARDELQRARRVRELTAQRVQAGVDSQLQLKQADAEVAAAEQQASQAARAIDAARSALSVLLGKGPDRGLDIARPQPLAPATVAVSDQLPVDLLGHRADLVAARWRVEATGRGIKAAKSQFLPNVSLGALAGLVAMGGTNLFQAPARFYQVGPSLSLPIFDGGRLRSNLQAKDADYDLAVARYNQTLVQAVNEVADDLSAQRSLVEQRQAQQRAVDAARQAWQLAELRYRAGIGSFLEALTVRQQLLTAEQRLAAIENQQVQQSIQLIGALGGGYRPRNLPAGAAADDRATASSPSSNSR